MEQNPNFLANKYPDLPGTEPVERAVEKAKRDPERVFAPHTRDERVQAYLDRIDRIVDSERGWELLRDNILRKFTIDTDDEDTLTKIAHGLYESEKRIATERGQGDTVAQPESTGGLLDKYKGAVMEKQEIQERSLGSWLDYLHQNDAKYPTWFRYFVVRNLEKMGTLDKEKGEYTKRTDYTIAPFPELNSEALGFVYRMLTTGIGHQEFTDEPEKREQLSKLIEKKDFIKLYTFAQIETAGQLNRESLQGEWKKYNQWSDHHILEQELRSKGTGWCTAEGSAYAHLQGGDFYVYFTKGNSGTYSEPRVAIRMEGDQVGEVRGVNHRQDLEPALVDIATEKYHTLPGGNKFDKKSQDMKRMTALVKKEEKGEEFTKDDLWFLYEIDAKIDGFGYDKDPRIETVLQNRDIREDIAFTLDIQKEEISLTKEEALRVGIRFHRGFLDFSSLTSAEGLKLPDHMVGDLHLRSLTSAEGLKLPDHISGNLYLSSLTSAEGLKLPDHIGGNLDLYSLTSAEGLKLPDHIGGALYLYSLTSAEGLKLPDHIGGNLDLYSLTSAEGLKLPDHIGGDLYLNNLTSEEKRVLQTKYPDLRIY